MTLQEAQAYYCELYREHHPGKDPRKSHNYKELPLIWAAYYDPPADKGTSEVKQ